MKRRASGTLIPTTLGAEYVVQDWVRDEPAAVLRAVARENGHHTDDLPHSDGGRPEYRRVARPPWSAWRRHRDIAILKTMGASACSITVIFMAQGLIIGILGTLAGATAGYVISSIADRYQLIRIPMDVYQVSHVPFTVLPLDFAGGRTGGGRHLFLRDDLSVSSSGRASGSGRGAPL